MIYVKSRRGRSCRKTIVHFLMLAGFTSAEYDSIDSITSDVVCVSPFTQGCPPAFSRAKDEGFAWKLCGHYGFIRSSRRETRTLNGTRSISFLSYDGSDVYICVRMCLEIPSCFHKIERDNRGTRSWLIKNWACTKQRDAKYNKLWTLLYVKFKHFMHLAVSNHCDPKLALCSLMHTWRAFFCLIYRSFPSVLYDLLK